MHNTAVSKPEAATYGTLEHVTSWWIWKPRRLLSVHLLTTRHIASSLSFLTAETHLPSDWPLEYDSEFNTMHETKRKCKIATILQYCIFSNIKSALIRLFSSSSVLFLVTLQRQLTAPPPAATHTHAYAHTPFHSPLPGPSLAHLLFIGHLHGCLMLINNSPVCQL